MAALQYVNVSGSRGALTADARQTARTINSYGEFRIKPIDSLTLIVGGIHPSGQRKIENRLDAQRNGKANLDSFAPKFRLLLEPADALQVYANYTRPVELLGFRALNQTPTKGVPG